MRRLRAAMYRRRAKKASAFLRHLDTLALALFDAANRLVEHVRQFPLEAGKFRLGLFEGPAIFPHLLLHPGHCQGIGRDVNHRR